MNENGYWTIEAQSYGILHNVVELASHNFWVLRRAVGCGKQRAPHRSRLARFVNSPHPKPAIGWTSVIGISHSFFSFWPISVDGKRPISIAYKSDCTGFLKISGNDCRLSSKYIGYNTRRLHIFLIEKTQITSQSLELTFNPKHINI